MQGVIVLNMIITSAFTYIFFILGAHITSDPALCGISSGFLLWFMLVFFCWTAVLSLWWWYLSLCGLSQKSKTRLIKFMMLASWSKLFHVYSVLISFSSCTHTVLPLLIVSLTAGIWHEYYFTDY